MADLQAHWDRIDGEWGSDKIRQAQHQQFDVSEIAHAFQAGELLPDEQGAVLARR